jgi:hypothetical protein
MSRLFSYAKRAYFWKHTGHLKNVLLFLYETFWVDNFFVQKRLQVLGYLEPIQNQNLLH